MLKLKTFLVLAVAAIGFGVPQAGGEILLKIHLIQYTDDPAGASDYDGQVLNCVGGIVTHKFRGGKPKLTLQDPNPPVDPKYAGGWAGIQVKDWTAGLELFDAVSVGDWVSLTNVEVEEFYGNTLLHYKPDNAAGLTRESTGNPLPPHMLVTVEEIAAPVEGPADEWYVADHSAEKYEAMLLTVEEVTVTAMDLGAKRDNYNLQGQAGDCWAGDYMNADAGGLYHPCVSVGAHFDSVSGILEQYRKDEFDYYQLLTTATDDLVPEPAAIVMLLVGAAAVPYRTRRSFPPAREQKG